MQENEFEKQVQQKMDELKLSPSGAVWQKIELQIRKEKRRRWLLIFLPVLLIGALYGGYVLLNNDNHTRQPQAITTLHESNTAVPNTQATKTITDPIKDEALPKEEETISQTPGTKNSSHQRLKVKSKLKLTTDHAQPAFLSKDTFAAATTTNATASIVDPGKTKVDIKSPEQENVVTPNEKRSDTIYANSTELTKQQTVDMAKDSTVTKSENPTTPDVVIPETKKAGKNKYPWNLGISFSAGTSGASNSLFGSLFGDVQKSFDPNATTGSGAYPLQPAASIIKPSVAFMTGVSAEKNISRKIIFTTGLNYKLFSTTNTVGADSLSFFDARSANRPYHNYYHYIELPAGLKFQIDIFKRMPLYWNTGLAISQLISSNALQFNNTTRLYYHDNSLFNKTQVGFNAGLDVELSSKQNRSFLLGPYFYYGISKIANQGYNKHHFTFIGLRAQYFFRKK